MEITIDGYEANSASRVGIGRYALEILTAIHSLSKNSPHHFRVLLPENPSQSMPAPGENWEYSVFKFKKFWTFIGLPFLIKTKQPQAEVVFSPTHYIPRFTSIPRVCAIMDVSYLHFPDLFRRQDLYKLRNWTAYSARNSTRIITISQHSKRDIIEAYALSPDKVTICYPGMTEIRHKNMEKNDLMKKYGLDRPFILSVGTLQPRKNYVRLIEAFSLVAKKHPDLDLVIVGKKGWLYEEILAAPQKWGITDKVKFLDFVPDSDLSRLYGQAQVFVLVSLYEGFGLPVAEAMKEKCPVVVGNNSSLPEVAGNAGIYVDPENTDEIASGLLKAISERRLKAGQKRIEVGLEHIKKFTWENAARQTLEVLEQAGKSGN